MNAYSAEKSVLFEVVVDKVPGRPLYVRKKLSKGSLEHFIIHGLDMECGQVIVRGPLLN